MRMADDDIADYLLYCCTIICCSFSVELSVVSRGETVAGLRLLSVYVFVIMCMSATAVLTRYVI